MDYEIHIYNEVTGAEHWMATYSEDSYDHALERAIIELETDLHNEHNLSVKYQDFDIEGSEDYYNYNEEIKRLLNEWSINVNELGVDYD